MRKNIQMILQKNICDLYDRVQKKAKIDINITYKKLDQSKDWQNTIGANMF